ALIEAKQLEPRGVRIDDDAFLHLDYGVIGAFENVLELAPRLVRGFEGRIQRALESEGPQLAQHDGLQARGILQSNKVPSAQLHRLGDAGSIRRVGNPDDGQFGGDLIAYGDDPAQVFAADHVYEQLRVDLGDRVGQIAQRRDPGAMRGLASAPQ